MKPLLISKERHTYIGVFNKEELWAFLEGKGGIVRMAQEDGIIHEYSIEEYNEMAKKHNSRMKTYSQSQAFKSIFRKIIEDEFVERYGNAILDDVERRYLKNVIRPFKNKVKYIMKGIRYCHNEEEYIIISIENSGGAIMLPYFKKGTMYKGMKLGKQYILEELGL